MIPSSILHDIETLPPEAQSQVVDFIHLIKSRYKKKADKYESEEDLGFGLHKVTKNISLEDMDKAIAQRACEL